MDDEFVIIGDFSIHPDDLQTTPAVSFCLFPILIYLTI